MQQATEQVWDWHRNAKLHMDMEIVPLKEIEKVWNITDFHGKRIVIIP